MRYLTMLFASKHAHSSDHIPYASGHRQGSHEGYYGSCISLCLVNLLGDANPAAGCCLHGPWEGQTLKKKNHIWFTYLFISLPPVSDVIRPKGFRFLLFHILLSPILGHVSKTESNTFGLEIDIQKVWGKINLSYAIFCKWCSLGW